MAFFTRKADGASRPAIASPQRPPAGRIASTEGDQSRAGYPARDLATHGA